MEPQKSWSERKGYIRDDSDLERDSADGNRIERGSLWLAAALSLLALGLIGILALLSFDLSVFAP